jgi:hypothetical protein
MIKYMDKVLALVMLVSALYTLYAVVTPNHLFIG